MSTRLLALAIAAFALLPLSCSGDSEDASPTAAAGGAGEATEVIRFVPAPPEGSAAREGSCFGNSLAAQGREDSWRCIERNQIYDPCFALDPEVIVCGANPSNGTPGFELTLTEPLPSLDVPAAAVAAAATNGWLVRLADGTICGFATGATGGVDDKRANYSCTDQRWILGDLTPGTVWMAHVATISVDADGWHADPREEAPIAVVWQ